jgi:hypothetical protein
MIEIRKIITTRETVFSELGVEASRPTTRAVGMAVIRNPFAGKFVEDLRPLFEAGATLGERLMPELVKLLDGPAVSYGKGAIVGVAGEMEHGGACVHPMLGKPMRAAIGGGKARRTPFRSTLTSLPFHFISLPATNTFSTLLVSIKVTIVPGTLFLGDRRTRQSPQRRADSPARAAAPKDSDRHARRRIKTSRKTRTQPCCGFDPPALDFD